MIKLKSITINDIDDLRSTVQKAIELEHSTIPPYLTANFTLIPTTNTEISKLIGSIVNEEMLHMTIACNLLNALGGQPVINKPDFVPAYPGTLPGGVEDGLIVTLEKFSKDLVLQKFMQIEEPEDPIKIKALALEPDQPLTIGGFYELICAAIATLEAEAKAKGTSIFPKHPANPQVTLQQFYPSDLLFPITDEASALKAIAIIVDQGEGTATDPFVDPNYSEDLEPAHYYRFEEIVKGKMLTKTPTGYAYDGDLIPFDNSQIPNMKENPKMSDYPMDTQAYMNCKLFNYNYTSLLNALHITFNGHPGNLVSAIGLMFSLRLYAQKLLALPHPKFPGYMCGPSFEYITDEDLNPAEMESIAANNKHSI
jgi:hypothetical protein